jgi:EAL domain-containing protein (putative c-di-GMP-specific phosphodiesterase class I)/ActR/RegA family two-component response regulator
MSEVQQQDPPRILLIDDDTDVLRAYARALRACGYQVDVATTAQDGLDNLGHTVYDAVFSDIVMPGLSGLDLLGAVRGYDLDVPVVLMTGNPRLETAIRAIEHGVARYLVKPISIEDLGDTAAWAIRMNALARSKRLALELTTTPGHRIGDRDTLAVRFSQALERLTVVFQPIVSWPTRSIYGYEALLRVRDSAFPTPPDFIAAAERLGRLREVGAAVRQGVAQAIEAVPPGTSVFVNLHPMDLLDEALYLPDAPLGRAPCTVVFELTERATLEQIDDLPQRRAMLRELGYQIAVDDLGAGYAGLSSLVSLEPDLVKIDMSLVRGVDLDPARQSVVRRIAEMVQDLGMEVIAEGVETQAERDMLSRLGCKLLQGYWFARPAPGFPTVDFSRGEP